MAVVNRAAQDREASRHHKLIDAICEAMSSDVGGEVVARWGGENGRIFITKSRVAWVSATSVDQTFLSSVVQETDESLEALREVFHECKLSGHNFGETIKEWGLVEAGRLRQLLLDHTALCLLEILAWPDAQTIFIPTTGRSYQDNLLLDTARVVERALELDLGGRVEEQDCVALMEQSRAMVAPLDELWLAGELPADIDPYQWEEDDDERSHVRVIQSPQSGEPLTRRALSIQKQLCDVRGFRGSAILDGGGHIVFDTGPDTLDIEGLDRSLRDLVQAALTVTSKVRGAPPQTVEIMSSDTMLLMRRVPLPEPAHDHHILAAFALPCDLSQAKFGLHRAARALSGLGPALETGTSDE